MVVKGTRQQARPSSDAYDGENPVLHVSACRVCRAQQVLVADLTSCGLPGCNTGPHRACVASSLSERSRRAWPNVLDVLLIALQTRWDDCLEPHRALLVLQRDL